MKIRKIKRNDLEELSRCINFYKEEKINFSIKGAKYLAISDKEVIGFASYHYDEYMGDGIMLNIFLLPEKRGLGLGLEALESVEQYLIANIKPKVIYAEIANPRSKSIFTKAGYTFKDSIWSKVVN